MEIKNFTITKRDGSKDLFSLDKIMNAIVKAFESVQEPADLAIVSKILNHLDMHDNITVEDIQNQVEEALMREGWDVIRFWVPQVRDQLPWCIAQIKNWMETA